MPNEALTLTIRATNGTPWETDHFERNQKVDHVRTKSIEHFVHHHVMTVGDYALALVRDNVAQPLIDANTLKESAVTSGSVLALVVRGPQVDG